MPKPEIVEEVKFSKKSVRTALGYIARLAPVIQGHLDLEGVVILKIVRSASQASFVMDATSLYMPDAWQGKTASRRFGRRSRGPR